jgi:3-oxoacyl-[acyl-carrier-protein] synthase II
MRRVVVTGVGVVSPLGDSARASFSALCEGRSAVAAISCFPSEQLPISVACENNTVDLVSRIGRRQSDQMDRFAQLAFVAAEEAVSEAALVGAYPALRVGVSVASGLGGILSVLDGDRALQQKGARFVSPYTMPKILPSIAAGWVSMRYGFQGPNLAPATACAASAHALLGAAEQIAANKADAFVVGGAEAPLCALSIASFAAMRALSPTACRPFDTKRDGFVLGEGAAIAVLEAEDTALARGASILAYLTGWGATGDAFHLTSPASEGEGCARAMRQALAQASLPPEAVDYINAHATGTPAGDLAEAQAIHALFGERPFVSSSKGASGHLLGAAGALEAIFCILALQEGRVPPSVGLQESDLPLRHVMSAQPAALEVAMSNSMGFGGTNASLLFQKKV